ncbi:MAG: hypothetical protein WKG07_29075 [Hymenobacter sp.]
MTRLADAHRHRRPPRLAGNANYLLNGQTGALVRMAMSASSGPAWPGRCNGLPTAEAFDDARRAEPVRPQRHRRLPAHARAWRPTWCAAAACPASPRSPCPWTWPPGLHRRVFAPSTPATPACATAFDPKQLRREPDRRRPSPPATACPLDQSHSRHHLLRGSELAQRRRHRNRSGRALRHEQAASGCA